VGQAQTVEEAQLEVAAAPQRWALQAERHHSRQLRTTRYPVRLFVLEISDSTQSKPLRHLKLRTREETKGRAFLFDMEFSQPLSPRSCVHRSTITFKKAGSESDLPSGVLIVTRSGRQGKCIGVWACRRLRQAALCFEMDRQAINNPTALNRHAHTPIRFS
jgi:hypothetical protein